MLKKIMIGVVLAVVLLFAGAALWARSVLTGEHVRSALAGQIEKAIGQPVSIGALDASIMPRVSVTLGDVTIGPPGKITVRDLQVGTDFRALLSRRIEHAKLTLTGARLELPLPAFAVSDSSTPPDSGSSEPPVELVSIDAIELKDVEVVSGGRTLRGDIELVPRGTTGLDIQRIALGADNTQINVTGRITDFNGPVGELTVKSGALDVDQLLAFVNDFTGGAGLDRPSASSAAPSSPGAPMPGNMNVSLTLETASATMGGLTLDKLAGQAKVAGEGITLDPVSFGIFGGQYQGSLALVPGTVLRFRGSSTLSNVDVAAAAAFAGSPETISGRLSGKVNFSGSGSDPSAVMKTVTGKGRVDITNGTIKNLGLINAVVLATSMRAGSLNQAASTAKSGSRDEPFTKLGATLDIGGGGLRTDDLAFESKDLLLSARGTVNLVASTVDLTGRVQLSDELSKQAGSDLVRYTQDQGRVTLPVTVTGSIEAPSARIDTGDMAKRALVNAANEQKERAKAEAGKAIKKGLGGLLGR